MFEKDSAPFSVFSNGSNEDFNGLTSSSPQFTDLSIAISAPGKVILHGEHSVVYGKLAVAASLGLRTRLTLVEMVGSREQGNVIKIEFPALNLIHSYDLNDVKTHLLDKPIPILKSSSKYNWEKPELINHAALLTLLEDFLEKTSGSSPLGVHQKISLCSFFYLFVGIFKSFEQPIKPFKLRVETDLTVSSGSGSSASFSVTLAAAFIQYVRIKTFSENLKDISKNQFKATKLINTDLNKFDERDLELISKWAYSTEKIIHGTPSGIDNTICTYGSVVEFRKSSGPKLIELCEFQLLLVNTKVKRDTKQLIRNVINLKENHPHVIELILEALDQISISAVNLLKQISSQNISHELENKLCFKQLGELTDMNQHLLEALGVSHSALNKICTILKNAGLCGKLTGAGGGGYAISLIPPYFETQHVQNIIEELNGEGFEAILTNLGGPGVTIDK